MAYLDGSRDADRDAHGRPILDDDLILIVNGWWEELSFTIPDVGEPRVWRTELDTFDLAGGAGDSIAGARPVLSPADEVKVGPRSVVLLAGGEPDVHPPKHPARRRQS